MNPNKNCANIAPLNDSLESKAQSFGQVANVSPESHLLFPHTAITDKNDCSICTHNKDLKNILCLRW